ncbi:MAG TPA: Na+/H+ antiporter subunit E [Halanaerobiales bacterium]|nr:Na+/H+ antiporter subunit E [Halanaerobiales bacterium]
MRENLITFFLVLGVWIIFAGRITREVLIVGFFVSIIVTYFFKDMLFRFSKKKIGMKNFIKKIGLIFAFVFVFFYEAFVSAIEVSKHAFEKEPSFSPGIVKVKTTLTNVSALTILANLITLTPGTLTLDFDKSERAYYIHWIDVKSTEDAAKRKEIIETFENWLGVIFE